MAYLESLGISQWVPRDFVVPSIESPEPQPSDNTISAEGEEPAPDIVLSEPVGDTAILSWQELKLMAQECTACGLHVGRTQAVFGTGDQSASLMVVGEAPGSDEDKAGEPFVGQAGQLLDQMLLAINAPRATVYIANIVKCRPPENRNPHHEEVLNCAQYLHRQIDLVSPKVILAVGKVAAQNLLQTDLSIGKMRGNQYHYAALGIPVIVTYHPAYLLGSPKEKSRVWQDLKLLRAFLT